MARGEPEREELFWDSFTAGSKWWGAQEPLQVSGFITLTPPPPPPFLFLFSGSPAPWSDSAGRSNFLLTSWLVSQTSFFRGGGSCKQLKLGGMGAAGVQKELNSSGSGHLRSWLELLMWSRMGGSGAGAGSRPGLGSRLWSWNFMWLQECLRLLDVTSAPAVVVPGVMLGSIMWTWSWFGIRTGVTVLVLKLYLVAEASEDL